jgi:hypothetical protein
MGDPGNVCSSIFGWVGLGDQEGLQVMTPMLEHVTGRYVHRINPMLEAN